MFSGNVCHALPSECQLYTPSLKASTEETVYRRLSWICQRHLTKNLTVDNYSNLQNNNPYIHIKVRWIRRTQSLISDRAQHVALHGQQSEELPVTSGPLGCRRALCWDLRYFCYTSTTLSKLWVFAKSDCLLMMFCMPVWRVLSQFIIFNLT